MRDCRRQKRLLLDASPWRRRGWDRLTGDRYQAFVRISKAAAPAFGLTATNIVALVDSSRPSEGNSGARSQHVRSLCAISTGVS